MSLFRRADEADECADGAGIGGEDYVGRSSSEQVVLITAADSTLDLQNFEDITKANVIAIGKDSGKWFRLGQYSKEVLTNSGESGIQWSAKRQMSRNQMLQKIFKMGRRGQVQTPESCLRQIMAATTD